MCACIQALQSDLHGSRVKTAQTVWQDYGFKQDYGIKPKRINRTILIYLIMSLKSRRLTNINMVNLNQILMGLKEAGLFILVGD